MIEECREIARGATSPRLQAFAVAVLAGVPVLLWGPPGGGKTSAATAVASSLDWPLEVVIGAVHDASDFAGLPVRSDDGVHLAAPSWARRLQAAVDGSSYGAEGHASGSAQASVGALLFLDELTTAHPSVQAAMLQVVLERRVGNLRLRDAVRVVAAANPPETAAGGSTLTAPLANRFVHLWWEPSGREIAEGFIGGWPAPSIRPLPNGWRDAVGGWAVRIGGFLLHRPELAHRVPDGLDQQGFAWPSPRSWDMAARLAAACDIGGYADEVWALLVAGCVGEGPATELAAWLASSDLPDPEELLAAPTSAPVPRRGDLVYATLGAVLAAVARDCSHGRWEAAWTVVARIAKDEGLDVAAVAAANLIRLRQSGWELPAQLDQFAPALQAMGRMS